jgi:hypothetical protein
VECAVSTLLTAVVIVGALQCVAATQRIRRAMREQRQDRELAQQLLSEIVQGFYLEPSGSATFGAEGDETLGNRSLFDDVDDYHLWSEGPPAGKDGSPLTGFAGWTRQVTVSWVDPANPNNAVGSDQGIKKISVSVTSPFGKTTTLAALRSSAGLGEQKPVATTSFVTWVGVEVKAGTSNTALTSGVNLGNAAQ